LFEAFVDSFELEAVAEQGGVELDGGNAAVGERGAHRPRRRQEEVDEHPERVRYRPPALAGHPPVEIGPDGLAVVPEVPGDRTDRRAPRM
jgi:hypothetical protein